MRLILGKQKIIIAPEMLSQALTTGVPGFLTGTEPCKTGLQSAIKRGLKAIMPMLLEGSHAFFKDAGIPAPDLKSREAKQNIIMYGLSYILASATVITDKADFIVEGVTTADGTIIVTGVDASPTELAEAEPAATITNGAHVGIAEPASPQEN